MAGLTRGELFEMLQAFVHHARRIKAIKDTLLYSNCFGSDCQILSMELSRQKDLEDEIDAIYLHSMLPILDRLVAFVADNADQADEILEAQRQCA